jgi:hypothetical protein
MVSPDPYANEADGAPRGNQPEEVAPRHRADYILVRGEWRVSCRVCGWNASDPARRRLASRFRFHLQVEQQSSGQRRGPAN